MNDSENIIKMQKGEMFRNLLVKEKKVEIEKNGKHKRRRKEKHFNFVLKLFEKLLLPKIKPMVKGFTDIGDT